MTCLCVCANARVYDDTNPAPLLTKHNLCARTFRASETASPFCLLLLLLLWCCVLLCLRCLCLLISLVACGLRCGGGVRRARGLQVYQLPRGDILSISVTGRSTRPRAAAGGVCWCWCVSVPSGGALRVLWVLRCLWRDDDPRSTKIDTESELS
jgi:hypothetical protein